MKGKKDFTGGLSSLLGESTSPQPDEKKSPGRPVTQTKEINKTSQVGTREEETRATFIVNETVLEKVKAIAYWERTQIKDVVADALEAHIERYERKNGALQPVPSKRK